MNDGRDGGELGQRHHNDIRTAATTTTTTAKTATPRRDVRSVHRRPASNLGILYTGNSAVRAGAVVASLLPASSQGPILIEARCELTFSAASAAAAAAVATSLHLTLFCAPSSPSDFPLFLPRVVRCVRQRLPGPLYESKRSLRLVPSRLDQSVGPLRCCHRV